MDKKALYKLEYGVFLLSARQGDKLNGCITNTCIQAAANPVRLAISCINGNLTTELIARSGLFTVTVLDGRVPFETIRRFGMQSGRETDKFAGIPFATDGNGLPYLTEHANAVLSCRVVSSQDLGSHMLFIGEVDDAKVLSDADSLTYTRYQREIKPRPQAVSAERQIIGWRCKLCGYVYEGAELPADFTCPLCGHGADDFEPIYK